MREYPGMTDFLIQSIDRVTLERLELLAGERGWSTNDTALRALRYALGISSEPVIGRDRQDIATMRGVWNQLENQAFSEAMDAFRKVDSGPSFETLPKSGK
ncbi:MAG: hypothetical protein IT476_11610 [Rhodanobacteraceae bacterium]|nr:hypothetical protein [Rhodanobacteraceae bacterium]